MTYQIIQLLKYIAKLLGHELIDMEYMGRRIVKYGDRGLTIIVDKPTAIGMIGKDLQLK